VNQTPIYSIVEYTYEDKYGKRHTRRIDRVDSKMVVRKQIQVGTRIPVKYAKEDPSKSVMVLDPIPGPDMPRIRIDHDS
jgi:hypothetical protein